MPLNVDPEKTISYRPDDAYRAVRRKAFWDMVRDIGISIAVMMGLVFLLSLIFNSRSQHMAYLEKCASAGYSQAECELRWTELRIREEQGYY